MPAPPALFDSLVDYAGLFPPAKLAMTDAVLNYASYRGGPHSSLLGRLVLPLARLAEFEAEFDRLAARGQTGWLLSVLAGPDPSADSAAILSFNSRHPAVRIVAVETKAGIPSDVARLTAAFPPDLEVWVEVPAQSDVAPFIAAIRSVHRQAKIRTGGITADAFPAAADVAGFLAACRDGRVLCKATAGLHHPLHGNHRLTYETGSPTGRMFGFLNVFLAAVLLHTGGTAADATGLLTESDPSTFSVSATAVTWRRHAFPAAQISAARQSLCRSFGSCSFIEPVEGLHHLHWL